MAISSLMIDSGIVEPPLLQRGAPWGTAASVALHLVFLAMLVLVSPLKQLAAPAPAAVAVEIVSPAEFAALHLSATPAPLSAPVPAPVPESVASDDRLPSGTPLQPDLPPSKTVVATKFYASAMLREPRMQAIAHTLTTLLDSERVVQLCNIEGLEQIRRAEPKYNPDTLVPYAMADMAGSGLTLIASGGAFRSRRKWFGISFKCVATSDYAGVSAFTLTLGDPIPEDIWDEHNLNAEDADE